MATKMKIFKFENEDEDDTRIGNNSWCLCGQIYFCTAIGCVVAIKLITLDIIASFEASRK